MKTLKEIFVEYKSKGLALPAFNIDSFEIYQAVEDAVRETYLPCIVQLSPSEDQFIQAERLFLLVKKAQLDGLPIYLNMDHNKDMLRLEKLVGLGFDMVHFDGSSLDYDINLNVAQKFIKDIKLKYPEIMVEVEFNKINLVNDSLSLNSLTTPEKAQEFMTATNADLLAVSIGNLHGVSTTIPEHIDLDLLQKIFDKLSLNNFITLHGGSGIGDDQISNAIKFGIVKININTDLRLKFKESLDRNLKSISTEKIYEILSPTIEEVKQIIKHKLTLFSSSNYV